MRPSVLIGFLLALSACATAPSDPRPPQAAPVTRAAPADTQTALNRFSAVVRRVEPVAEAQCRALSPQNICDYRILVDDRPGQPSNAFFTLTDSGLPLMVFTLPLLRDVANDDEIAFIIGHEAAHHIAGHIPRGRQNAALGQMVLGGLVGLAGGSSGAVRIAGDIGATVGARRYSKDFELEADRIGTLIAARAGYDPVRGAEYFARIPDPGDRFLGTHPANIDRIKVVRRTAQGL